MANEFYDHTTYPSTGASGSSSAMRSELNAIEAGFDKLPTMAGNGSEVVKVNAGGTALETQAADALEAATIHAATSKTTPVDADEIGIVDSAASNGLKKLTWANLKATLATWLETLTATWSNKTFVAPALGTPSSGTLTNCTGLPLAGVVDSTTEALGVGSLEVGHASDTTLTRVSAGTVAVEGVNVLTTATGAALAGSASQAFSASNYTTAQGLQFPATQNASANANCLDDYEEGTWTTTMTGATVVGTPTYLGSYIKIGSLVKFTLYITSTTSFASPDRTSCYFTLPFAPQPDAGGVSVLSACNAGSNAEYGQNTIASNNRAYLPVIPATSDIIVTGTHKANS